MTKTTSFSPMASTFAIVCGAVFWAALFAFVGAMTGHAWSGAACGTVIGAVIGYGFTKHLIGRAVVWVSVFGVLGAVIGPGCDADACSSAVGGAVIGGLLGWFGWLGIFMFLFGVDTTRVELGQLSAWCSERRRHGSLRIAIEGLHYSTDLEAASHPRMASQLQPLPRRDSTERKAAIEASLSKPCRATSDLCFP